MDLKCQSSLYYYSYDLFSVEVLQFEKSSGSGKLTGLPRADRPRFLSLSVKFEERVINPRIDTEIGNLTSIMLAQYGRSVNFLSS